MYLQIDHSAGQPAAHTGRYGRQKYLKRSPNLAVKLENSRVQNGSIKRTCEAGLRREALMTRSAGLWEAAGEAGRAWGRLPRNWSRGRTIMKSRNILPFIPFLAEGEGADGEGGRRKGNVRVVIL